VGRGRRGVSSFWCESAWLGGLEAEAGVLLDVEGETISSVQTGVAAAPPGAERLRGLVIPGLANAHSHAFQRALRGRTHRAQRGSFWTWREQMYALASALDPDAMRVLARATFAEMALAGVTVVGEFHYLHHADGGRRYSDPNAMGEAVLEAAREAGIRITLLDTCYLAGGVGPDGTSQPLAGPQLRFGDGDADSCAQGGDRADAGLCVQPEDDHHRPRHDRRVAEQGQRQTHRHLGQRQPVELQRYQGG